MVGIPHFFIMKVDMSVPYKVIACDPERVKKIERNNKSIDNMSDIIKVCNLE